MQLPENMTKEQADAQLAKIAQDMKAYLKTCSKNELIRIVFEHVNMFIEQRNVVKKLEQQLAELLNNQENK